MQLEPHKPVFGHHKDAEKTLIYSFHFIHTAKAHLPVRFLVSY